MMRGNKGITLIALVITIIVLLILAGVAIAMLSGENGILTKAREAAKENAIASAKEQVALVVAEAITEYYDNVYVDGDNAVKTTGVQQTVLAKLATITATAYDDITYTAPTGTTAEGVTTYANAFSIKYNGDATVYNGTVDANGVLDWDLAE